MATETFTSETTLYSDTGGSKKRNMLIGRSLLNACKGELGLGADIKRTVGDDLLALIDENEVYSSTPDSVTENVELLTNKLFRFRPRLVGAVGAYQHLIGASYESLVEQKGMDSFYLFWALGSIQDDFIDELPKTDHLEKEEKRNKSMVGRSIFGGDRTFYRAAHHQLRQQIKTANFGEAQERYLQQKVTDWYRFLIEQEAEVLDTPFEDMSFKYCREYRESQNLQAGSALAAMLNGTSCLDPRRQQIEGTMARFSYLTQIIDDIADTAEDMTAKRPSYAVGALMDNPAELQLMREYIAMNPDCKLTPRRFRRLAPDAYQMVHGAFADYSSELRQSPGGAELTRVASRLFHVFPYVRNVLYRVDPKYANF